MAGAIPHLATHQTWLDPRVDTYFRRHQQAKSHPHLTCLWRRNEYGQIGVNSLKCAVTVHLKHISCAGELISSGPTFRLTTNVRTATMAVPPEGCGCPIDSFCGGENATVPSSRMSPAPMTTLKVNSSGYRQNAQSGARLCQCQRKDGICDIWIVINPTKIPP